jgi:uncharacterized RDD family membrane protein YckC
MWKTQLSPLTIFAGFWVRFLAFIIDIIILGIFSWVFNGVWSLARGAGWMSGGAADPFTEVTGVSWLVGSLVMFFVTVAYLICFWGWRGQTPGKMLFRIKIIRSDGSDIGWSVATLRFLSYIISFLLAFIGYFWVAFDVCKQGLHDKMADTYVIRLPGK